MKIRKEILRVVEGSVLLLVAWSIVGFLMNSKSVDEIRVFLKPDGVEHRDKTLLSIGKHDEAPDYRLRARYEGRWKDLGTYGNTWIGDGLIFHPQENLEFRELQELQLLDDDKLESDVLEQFPFRGNERIGNNYRIEVISRWDLQSGVRWFFKTPVGLSILTGITIAVAFIILSNM